MDNDRIREVYLSCGFTIKEGQTDLKPYVFESARAIEAEVSAPLLSEIAYLRQFKEGYEEWMTKTEWVQETAYVSDLGKHRADVLRGRIESLQSTTASQAQDLLGAVHRIKDMLDDPDGQSYKEARKWVERISAKYGFKEDNT